jgi:plasmid stabilization system protein ParE
LAQSIRGSGSFLQSGRRGKVSGTRELLVPRTPYVAIYEVRGDLVFVLRVIHGAQQWPPRDLT